jgi:hypothetical protein
MPVPKPRQRVLRWCRRRETRCSGLQRAKSRTPRGPHDRRRVHGRGGRRHGPPKQVGQPQQERLALLVLVLVPVLVLLKEPSQALPRLASNCRNLRRVLLRRLGRHDHHDHRGRHLAGHLVLHPRLAAAAAAARLLLAEPLVPLVLTLTLGRKRDLRLQPAAAAAAVLPSQGRRSLEP